jgi:methionyl-tRNA synthetase
MNFIDQGSGLPLKRVQEESYFFRMSKYGDWLIEYIESNPESIQPEQFRNNILTRLRTDPLKDLSISRTTFSWGVPVPEGFDPRHVMYVWFDALTNYGSGVQFLNPEAELNKYWPAQVHLIGKDIVWFHSVIWPCMLKSAGLPLPRQVYCHGFVNAADGRKMSKSYNNTIDPMEVSLSLLTSFPHPSVVRFWISTPRTRSDITPSWPHRMAPTLTSQPKPWR